jgi:hypothetical protein
MWPLASVTMGHNAAGPQLPVSQLIYEVEISGIPNQLCTHLSIECPASEEDSPVIGVAFCAILKTSSPCAVVRVTIPLCNTPGSDPKLRNL